MPPLNFDDLLLAFSIGRCLIKVYVPIPLFFKHNSPMLNYDDYYVEVCLLGEPFTITSPTCKHICKYLTKLPLRS